MVKRRGRPRGDAPKVTAVATRLAARLASGTYLTVSLPTEQELAAEMGVSYLTARRAVAQLVNKGLLRRAPYGPLELARGHARGRRPHQVAFVVASWNSFDVLRWHRALSQAAATASVPMTVSTAAIHNWDDPLLTRLLAKADGVVVYPGPWDGSHLPARLKRARARVLAVDRDCSALGLPSLCPVPPEGVDSLLDHLWSRGHRRIGCIGALPGNDVEAARGQRYLAWCAARGIAVERIDSDRVALSHALRKKARPTALLAIAVADAFIALRVARDAGLAVPDELAVAVVNDEGLGEVVVPSLTALAASDLASELGRAMEWMAGGAYPWGEARCIQPKTLKVIARESG